MANMFDQFDAADESTGPTQEVEQTASDNMFDQFDAPAEDPLLSPELEAAATILTSGFAEPASGYAGAARGAYETIFGDNASEKAAQTVEDVRNLLTYEPQSEEAIENLEAIANLPVIKQLGQLSEQYQENVVEPIAGTLGEASPEAGAIVEGTLSVLPEGVMAALGARGATMFSKETKTQRKAEKLLKEGSTEKLTAKYELIDPDQKIEGSEDIQAQPVKSASEKFQETLLSGTPKVRRDKAAVKAINQGFDEGVIAAIKGASSADKAKMKEMARIMEKAKGDTRFAMTNRPSDVAGDSLIERFSYVANKNDEAGKNLDIEAKKLQGQQVELNQPIGAFSEKLDDFGVTFDDAGNPIFEGSDFEGLDVPQKALTNIITRARKVGQNPDAYEVHRLKRYIDENVNYGKSQDGLSARADSAIKELRSGLDDVLDSSFPDYNEVNTVYADTREALDALQSAAGSKMDLKGKNASKATGTLLRRLMSNAQSRVNLMDSIDEIEAVGRKYGADFNDDIMTQILFADELDSVFKPVARTSFENLATRQVTNMISPEKGMVEKAMDIAGDQLKKVKGVTEETQFKAINELLDK